MLKFYSNPIIVSKYCFYQTIYDFRTLTRIYNKKYNKLFSRRSPGSNNMDIMYKY